MAYLVNNARVSSLTIGGVDYTNSLLNWQVSDASCNKNGFVATNGTIVLGNSPSLDITDYDRNIFKRGTETVLTIQYPSGNSAVHPRGLLYVIGVGYNPDSETLEVEIGCKISLAVLMDDTTNLYPLAPMTLDATQREIGNINSAFVTKSQYVYQDNTGNLVTGTFYDGDTNAGVAAGDWVSIQGVTALSAAPLAGASPMPDKLRVTYQVPTSTIADANPNPPPEFSSETTVYSINFPGTNFERKGTGNLNDISGTQTSEATDGRTSSCGNTPDRPADNGTPSCNDSYETIQVARILPARKVVTTQKNYNGPGGQENFYQQTVLGPRLEANNQYYADFYAFCKGAWGSSCQPSGGCDIIMSQATFNTILERTTVNNFYGSDGALQRKVENKYIPLAAAAKPQDWRSGVTNGKTQNFQTISFSLFNVNRVETRWYRSGSINYEVTTTYESNAVNGGGISGGGYQAISGAKTVVIKKSGTITASPLRPSSSATPTTETIDKIEERDIFVNNYVTPPSEAGPYILEESVPIPILITNKDTQRQVVVEYVDYLERWIKGEVFGLHLGESMREEICTGWYPGRPFRYYDPKKNKLMAMRMDACSWTADTNGAALAFNGIWIGNSNGSVTLPSNVVGDSRPDMSGGTNTTPPVGPGAPPSVSNETAVGSGALSFYVDVDISTQVSLDFVEANNKAAEASYTVNVFMTTTNWASGALTTAGSILATDYLGNIPVSYNGSLLTENAIVVDPDLFSA